MAKLASLQSKFGNSDPDHGTGFCDVFKNNKMTLQLNQMQDVGR